jgi:adenine phosphoribosyltransferase
MTSLESEVKGSIRIVHNYPKRGVSFKDLTTLWKDASLMKRTTDAIADYWRSRYVDKIVGIEARGFIVGAPLAERLGVGFVPARKAGKLPSKAVRVSYELEYGKHSLEIHSDGVAKGEKVLIVDDLLATGGTANAVRKLVQKLGGTVLGFAFVAELDYLHGRRRLSGYEIQSLAKYDSEN